ncbi:MAG TPA: alpha/beta hydrolase-fold protein [Mesorhizobium sp.]|uniref:alpha/beta hydrolase n=1 Tax=Mesorhizobium sp. TaxID=1871066 RepID=UPI002DDCEE5F|nr:alpha/beta hydrolase-fold protein [Mesorhizobium sp.]HEV2503275.1 alpha/beta hydrolase-fold protein [Mesorhizobium sp.]
MAIGVAGTAMAGEPTRMSFDLGGPDDIVRRVFLSVPDGPAPTQGFPVVYLIDGNTTFDLARQVLAREPDVQAVLVGIGYPGDSREEIVRLRFFDLTPPTPAELIPPGMNVPKTGGADAFLEFLQSTVKPEVERRVAVDPTRQTLFGHSLGGLLALHVLFSRPDAFQTYIAADPSIWWNGRSILGEMEQFLRDPSAGEGRRLLIETSGKRAQRAGADAATLERIEKLRSGPNGHDVQETLRASRLKLGYRQFTDESHGSMIPFAVADALRFSLLGISPAPATDGSTTPDGK